MKFYHLFFMFQFLLPRSGLENLCQTLSQDFKKMNKKTARGFCKKQSRKDLFDLAAFFSTKKAAAQLLEILTQVFDKGFRARFLDICGKNRIDF